MYIQKDEILLKYTPFSLSFGLYLFSLTQQCYCTEISCGDSIAVVISGFFGFALGGAGITWLANPALWYSWIKRKNIFQSLISSSIALVLSIAFLFFDEVIGNEAGHYYQIIKYKSGYWIWLASCLTMAMGNIFLYLKNRKANS